MNPEETNMEPSSKELKSILFGLKKEFDRELNRLLDFWAKETIDVKNGGFLGEIDHYGLKSSKAPKGSVLNARILWVFSAAYRTTQEQMYKELANRSYQYLVKHFWDREYGGLIWQVDYLGKPQDKRKQAYAQGFGIYAFSEYYRAVKNEDSLNYAKELYKIVENNFWDNKHTGYLEALQLDWQKIEDMRLSVKDMNAPKSMNTHLHILEPYTNLYRVWPNEELKKSIGSLIQIFANKIADPKTKHLNLFFENDWTPISTQVSFGHDIEAAWLLREADRVIHNHQLDEKVKKLSLSLVNSTLNEGLDLDGSLFNERDGAKYDTDKHWWPQAEAMVGLMDAYQMDRKSDYITHLQKVWIFIKNNLIDQEKGEWFWRVDQNGIPAATEVKVGFWKCPYHNCRALMELIERIENLNI